MSYSIAKNLQQALGFLREAGGQARVIAGGTDLFLKPLPPVLVDLTAVGEAAVLQEKEGRISCGACVTHAVAAASTLLRAKAPVLAEACGQVGSPQVRNLGTLGGNVVNAAPAADAAVALVVLGARALIAGGDGETWEQPVESLYARYNRSSIDSSREILLKFVFDGHGPGEGSAFQRFSSRRALSLPMFSVAAYARVADGRLQEVRLTAAPGKPAPTRLPQAEKKLRGMPAAAETYRLAAELVREEITVRGSALRCSEDYRRHLAGVLAARALAEAARRAENSRAGEYL